MKKKIENELGITLIALVITIILLLILAGITISQLTGSGLFGKALLAKEKYENAQKKEQEELDKYLKFLNGNIVEKEETTGNEKITAITLNKTTTSIDVGSEETLKATITPTNASDQNLTWESSNTSVATVDNGKITAIAEGTTIITATAKDGSGVSGSCTVTVTTAPLAEVVEIGDYVAYDPTEGVTDTSKLTYVSPVGTGTSHGNGSREQTFTASSTKKWRVLSKNESTGEVILISETGISPSEHSRFYIKGAVGYLYAEQELNSACAVYGYGKGADTTKVHSYETGDIIEGTKTGTITSGARSIKVEDINKIVGYTPPTTGTSSTKTQVYVTSSTESGWANSSGEISLQDLNYVYNVDDFDNLDDNIYEVLFKDRLYWISGRIMYMGSYYWNYGVFCLAYNGNMAANGIAEGGWSAGTDNERYDWLPRPMIYLKTTVQTNGKDNSGAWNIIDN